MHETILFVINGIKIFNIPKVNDPFRDFLDDRNQCNCSIIRSDL